jgi:eukaryotic-like serine/threonine-protein kinase
MDSATLDAEARLAALRDDQYRRWQAGEPVPSERYLSEAIDLSAEDALILIWAEVRLRAARGETPQLAEFQARFPEYAELLARQFELELLMGSLSDATVSLDSSSLTVGGEVHAPPGYEIIAEIGRGAMGVVYKAHQIGLNRFVALKVLRTGDSADADRAARFQQEAALAARLQHPNIVQVFEYGIHAGRAFIAMQLVEGRTLASETGGLPQPAIAAARRVELLASAIHFAHTHGVVHRDLKPANVLVGLDDELRIVDFGLAKELQGVSTQTTTGLVLGTPAYMAPEQAAGRTHSVGPTTDVWALGAILYELLTGRPPFRGESPVATLQQVIAVEPIVPSRLQPRIPRDLETICLKCLEKSPARRYASAAALADDLRRYQIGESIQARPVRAPERAWRWCRRNPGWAAMMGSAAALLAVIAFGGIVMSVRLNEALGQSKQDREAAIRSRAEAEDRLWEGQITQARAIRIANGLNARRDSIALLETASRTRVSSVLRNEFIAALALPDIRLAREWDGWPDGSHSIAFSADFDCYARSDESNTIAIRRTSDDAELGRIKGPGPSANHAWMSPDGQSIAAMFENGNGSGFYLGLWRREATECRLIWNRSVAFDTHVVFSSDSQRALIVDQLSGKTHVYETASDTLVRPFPIIGSDYWFGLAYHPSGNLLAVASANAVRVYNVSTGEKTGEVTIPGSTYVASVAWNPANSNLLIGWGNKDGERLSQWEYATRTLTVNYDGHIGQGIRGAFDSTGRMVASNNWGDTLRIFDTRTGLPLFRMSASTSQVHKFAHSSGLMGADVLGGEIRLLQIGASPEMRTLPSPKPTRFPLAQIDRDNRLLAVGTGAELALWDLDTCREITRLPTQGFPMAFEKPGTLLAAGADGLKEWQFDWDRDKGVRKSEKFKLLWPKFAILDAYAMTRKTIVSSDRNKVYVGFPWQVRFPIQLPHSDVRCTLVSPDGRWVVTCAHEPQPGDPANVKVWDMTAAEPTKPARKLAAGVGANAVFSPDGRWLATATLYGGCRLWRVGIWEPGPVIGGKYPLFTPDGQMLVTETGHGELRMCMADSGEEVVRLASPFPTRMRPLCFSPDGGRLVVWGTETGAIHVWELKSIRDQLRSRGLDW